jgi:hypothetical protein
MPNRTAPPPVPARPKLPVGTVPLELVMRPTAHNGILCPVISATPNRPMMSRTGRRQTGSRS